METPDGAAAAVMSSDPDDVTKLHQRGVLIRDWIRLSLFNFGGQVEFVNQI